MVDDVVRLRLDIAYDGTGFSGWAAQPARRTVQGEIEAAFGTVLRMGGERPVLTVAGRTDAGVHARGQVAHVDLSEAAIAALARDAGPRDVAERLPGLLKRVNGVLVPDVRVRGLSVAPEGFDARFSALWRRYAYRVSDDPAGVDPLRRHDVLWHSRPLDVVRLNEAAARLLGEHDFAAFCKRREGATTIRELRRLDWTREPGEGGALVATVVADAFCHSMVRALVGALLWVGDGRREVAWPGEVLRRAVRDSAVTVAPAHGLCLEEVRYPPPGELARRAEATRRVRTLPV
ncbi:tRNA pseudouridine(38-40) synthase TruA [Spongiactinospora gelatinilytica]|uniref:tRNA pseudouridine synthase A n=1 Tax=Spongiactinospora gelatinilytica TaxID=2666298 RepID=A0A2W2HMW0_9ACTN|nr:tRNA pseudouridine(38-40) synthase TruA [Spongiactinospora gelatinilytica]PZG51068.1 tRNA pseudouridine(38-40) synthase TruA [Spongiactinospora gelatinilytica]